jgi:hypothetical protein
MEGGGPIPLDVKPLEEMSSEMGDELGPPIRDCINRKAVVFPNMSTVQLSCLFGRDIRGGRDEMSHFCETVHAHEDCIVALRRWQLDDEVHGDGLPWSGGNRERLEIAERGVTWNFIAHTGLAGVDVFVDELPHPWPVVISRNQLQGLFLSQVSRCFGVVKFLEDIHLNLIDGWHIHPAIV